jgi:toxin-antitoxin system PIN domain toxin
MIALDTNLLVYAHRARTPQHRAARRVIERAAGNPHGWGIATPVLPEFWSVVTHPACEGGPSTSVQASRFIEALRQAGAATWLPGPGFGERLLQVAADRRITGPRIFDLQIAMIAFENGATELWSHDSAFLTVPGLRLLDPLG